MSDNNKSSKISISKWLDSLQQDSWQLELLISAFAIFGLFSLREYLGDVIFQFTPHAVGLTSVFLYILLIASYSATIIFIINLLIHLFVRALWIGAIGLRYVSGDIEYDKLKYNSRFTDFYTRSIGSFDSYIESLEKLASVMFSYTFLLFFIYMSLLIFVIEMLVIGVLATFFFGDSIDGVRNSIYLNLGGNIMTFMVLLFIIANIFLGLIVVIDLLTLGALKRIRQKQFAAFYYWISRYIGMITLSFIWRPLLLNFLDYKFTRILFSLAIPYGLAITLFLPSYSINHSSYFPQVNDETTLHGEHTYFPQFYDDELLLRAEDQLEIDMFTIPSKRISGPTFEIFINSSFNDNFLVSDLDTSIKVIRKKGLVSSIFNRNYTKEWDNLSTEEKKENIRKIKDILQSSVIIKIDDQTINPSVISSDYYIHPNNDENGMLFFFPLDSINKGRHILTVEKLRVNDPDTLLFDTMSQSIPFYFEGL